MAGADDFERSIVHMFNHWFQDQASMPGIAYRDKQAMYVSQKVDVLVDSPRTTNLGIEAKSVKTASTNKLYFSQHFSENEDGHQVPRITEFLYRSGRTGWLALELRNGRGKPREAFMVPWRRVYNVFTRGVAGISLDDVRSMTAEDENVHELHRAGGEYQFPVTFRKHMRTGE